MPKDQKTIEVEGVSTREAIKKALKILGATRDKVKIKVLSEENKGLFGMKGARQAKVRVSLREDRNK
jgi:spoIIIJ-associated protein